MQAQGLDWGEGYRPFGRLALAEIIEKEMATAVDRWLESLEAGDAADRRNGYYRRSLLTELGDIELFVPRTRRYCPTEVVRAYARRSPEIDRMILAGFVLGLSTRKLGEVLLCLLGRPVSPTTVSRVAQSLDKTVAAFHARPLKGRYKALMLDGVVLARKTGAGALRRPVLVALGLRHLHAVMNADTATKARSAARRFAERWRKAYPAAVACLRDDLDQLLTCFRYKTLAARKAVRTTNAIERRFREVRRRTRPMGVFQDRTSMDPILFAVFTHENKMQGIPTLLGLTQNI